MADDQRSAPDGKLGGSAPSRDRFVIPLSFSKVTIVFDELLDVSCDLDDDAFEARRMEVENLMRWSGRSGPACK
jgi:hypothetical protein